MAFKIVKEMEMFHARYSSEGKVEYNVTKEDSDNFVDMNDLLKKGAKVKLVLDAMVYGYQMESSAVLGGQNK